jgi:hypothetical protein
MKKISEEEIKEAFKPLTAFLGELLDMTKMISDMEFSEENKIIGQIENTTINRLIKRHCRSVVDSTGSMLRNPHRKKERLLSKSEVEQLIEILKQARSERDKPTDEPKESAANATENKPAAESESEAVEDGADEFDDSVEIYENE